MVLLRPGQMIFGLAITPESIFGSYEAHNRHFGYNPQQISLNIQSSSLILSEEDVRIRHKRITTYHDKITDLVDPKWIYRSWENPSPMPTDVELVEVSDAIQIQISRLMDSPSDEPVIEEIEPSSTGILGIYLGQWFINPDKDFQQENRVIRVLIGEKVVWIPVIAR